MANETSFLDFLRNRHSSGGFTNDDALASALPLFKAVQDAHAVGCIAPLEGVDELRVEGVKIWFEQIRRGNPISNLGRVQNIDQRRNLALDIVGERKVTYDLDKAQDSQENLLIARPGDEWTRPRYLPGYRSWEHEIDHHDALTDIFILGQILASLACGLDLTQDEDLARFVNARGNLFALSPQLNPVIARVILNMTELSRHERAQDLDMLIRQLENYRDMEVERDLKFEQEEAFNAADLDGKRQMVLRRLQERLFEISRRNRLLYFKPSLQNLNLTLASVPVLFDVRSIRAEKLFTWQGVVAKKVSRGDKISLHTYLRFESAHYLPGVLDKLISDAHRERAEFGFSQLRLVLCFLRWHNLKEDKQERIHSPLLLMPVKLTKKRGVRDTYTLHPAGETAEVNPVLRYFLKTTYGIKLPEEVSLENESLDALHAEIEAQIHATEPGVVLRKIDKPKIELIQERARRRLDQYRRTLRTSGRGVRSYGEIDYSYRPENFQPLGLRLFQSLVKPSISPMRSEAEPPLGTPYMVAPAEDKKDEQGHPVAEQTRDLAAFQEGSEANPYVWDFDLCSITLGNFRYRKMTLVKDYEELIEKKLDCAAFEDLFSLEPRNDDRDKVPPLPLENRYPVVKCDPTQAGAIAFARTGRSYIIQGPPGTGKSQTITNLIADYIARGKRVLFVCEKRAALDVVFHRLRQQGLHQLCCLIHDSQEDKKAFIQDLKETYEQFKLEPDRDAGNPEHARQEALRILNQEQAGLERFNTAMKSVPEEASVALRRLLQRLVALRERLPQLEPADLETFPPYRTWTQNDHALRRFDRNLREIQKDGIFRHHALHRLAPGLGKAERPFETVTTHLKEAQALLERVEAALAETDLERELWDTLGEAEQLVAYARQVQTLSERRLLSLLDSNSGPSREFLSYRRAHDKLRTLCAQASEKTRYWQEGRKLSQREAENALGQARVLEGSLFRVLMPSWWRLRRILKERYDFRASAVVPVWSQILEELLDEYKARADLDEKETQARDTYGAEEGFEAFWSSVEEWRKGLEHLPVSARKLHERMLAATEPAKASQVLTKLGKLQGELERLQGVLNVIFADSAVHSFPGLHEQLESVHAHLDDLSEILPCLNELAEAPDDLAAALRRWPFDLEQLESAMAERTLRGIYRGDSDLRRFTEASRVRHVERLQEAMDRFEEVNSACVIDRVRRKFLNDYRISTKPTSECTAEEKEFGKKFNAGRKILEHEFGKVMRFKSIRDLASDESGPLIMDLKPVWLMSPLSVSDALPLADSLFDVVIYDEASQIPLEEAVPPLFRGSQSIVVGDQMQMPPTSFFSSRGSDDDSLFEEDEQVADLGLEADSFLSHAARHLQSTLLGWHYRSRREALVSFSNAAFYERRLLTIPDRRIQHAGMQEIVVRNPADGSLNLEALLARGVSFHYLEKGLYENRRNADEASYIAELVRTLLEQKSGLSIGIVAFSEAQQEQIEGALERLAQEDPEFRNLLEAEFEREENDQFVGLLVKNLENIQGDERDLIILSVCYGPDRNGKVRMNFGPINQRGGEKRLNVAFSRAKRHMAVVSSIKYEAITNTFNDGARCLRDYLEYTAALSRGDFPTARRVLHALSPLRDRVESEESRDVVALQIAEQFVTRGFEVECGVGDSHFTVDLGIYRPGEKDYLLGILIDNDAHYRQDDLLERDVQRPSVLRAFDWKIAHVLTKDWYHEPKEVVERLSRMIQAK